jgi:hypothetical protein
MKKTEMVQIITLLAGNYDSIANKSQIQRELMLNTWYECLGDLDYQIVLQAVKKSIINSIYPPTIHEVRKNAIEMINPTTKKTAIEAWNEALKMISNGIYMTQEQFQSCSPDVKKFFGSVNQVRQLAMLDSDTINSVTKGQFLKQYEILVEREQEEKMLPEKMNNIIGGLVKQFTLKEGGLEDE